MDKVIIFDVFEFIGFHVCRRMLDHGHEVKGIHSDAFGDIEEKRLEIGRNANFTEISISETELTPEENESALLIFSLYDWFSRNDLIYKHIKQLLKEYRKNQVVFLLPVQLLANTNNLSQIEGFQSLLANVKDHDVDVQFFYLPTIFGPWQPSTFLFQKTMLHTLNKDEGGQFTAESSEWREDAIFIEDALDLIVDMIKLGKKGKYLVESGIDDSWIQCAKLLKLDSGYTDECASLDKINDDGIKRIQIRKCTPFQDSLTIQKKHLSLIMNLRDGIERKIE